MKKIIGLILFIYGQYKESSKFLFEIDEKEKPKNLNTLKSLKGGIENGKH